MLLSIPCHPHSHRNMSESQCFVLWHHKQTCKPDTSRWKGVFCAHLSGAAAWCLFLLSVCQRKERPQRRRKSQLQPTKRRPSSNLQQAARAAKQISTLLLPAFPQPQLFVLTLRLTRLRALSRMARRGTGLNRTLKSRDRGARRPCQRQAAENAGPACIEAVSKKRWASFAWEQTGNSHEIGSALRSHAQQNQDGWPCLAATGAIRGNGGRCWRRPRGQRGGEGGGGGGEGRLKFLSSSTNERKGGGVLLEATGG